MISVSPVGEKIIYPVCARFVFMFPPSRVVMVVVVMVVVVIIKCRVERVALHAVLLKIRLLFLMEISRMLVIMIMKVILVDVVQFTESETQAVFVGLVSPYGGRGLRVGGVRARVRRRPGALLTGNHFTRVQRRSRGANVVIIINR